MTRLAARRRGPQGTLGASVSFGAAVLLAAAAARADEPSSEAVPPASSEPAPSASPATSAPAATPTISAEGKAWEAKHGQSGLGLHGGGALDGSFHSLGSLPVHAYGLTAFFGGDALEHFGLYGEAGFALGKSQHGLSTRFVRLGVRGEAIFDRFRFGGGPQIVYFGLRRVSNRQILDSFGLGLYAVGSVDLWQPQPHSGLFLGVRLDADVFAKILLAGATAEVGYRF